MALWIFPVCFGVLNIVSGVYCKIFQAQNTVVWYNADATCRESNGTLFKLDKASFDKYLLPQTRFNTDSWVAATNILATDTETYFRNDLPTSSYRCVAVETHRDCSVQYWHKACNATYRPICEWNHAGRQWIYEIQVDWKEASTLCQRQGTQLAESINAWQLLNWGPCQHGLYWTGKVIKVIFQNKRPNYNLDACGILRNHVLSFENCMTRLPPLCEIEENSTTRPPRRYYGTSITTLYSFLKNSAIATMTTSRTMSKTASRATSKASTAGAVTTSRTFKSMPTNLVLRSTTIKQFVAFDVASQRSKTTHWLSAGVNEENKSSFPSETNIERDIGASHLPEPKPNSPDIGVIVGSVLGCVVFLLLIVTLIILLQKRRSQRNETSDASKHAEKSKSTRMNKSLISMYSVQKQNVVPQLVVNNEAYVSYSSNSEQQGNRCIMEEISKSNHSFSSVAGSETKFANYATVKPKAIRKSNKSNTNFTSEVNDQLNDQKEMASENVFYDKANIVFRDCPNVQSEGIYVNQSGSIHDTANEYGKTISQSDRVYDKAKIGGFDEYDTTYVTRRDTDFTYDHV